jgi:two-component sensor histidine kinase
MAAWFTFVSDTIFATIWIYATGGFYSPYYVMLYTSIIAVAFRFSIKATFLISTFYILCYFFLMWFMDQLIGNEVVIIIRTGFIFIIGYFSSLIIEETHEQVKAKQVALSFKVELEKQVEQRTEELEHSLQQVNTLLKEVHHRVKNNLQIISSLLNLQSNEENNPEVKEALLKSKNRILSIALIHQNLYGSKNLSSIKARDFIEQLVLNIKNSIEQNASKITTNINVSKDLLFNMDVMTPLGLIINELLTNSYKYAFSKNAEGDISISINSVGENQFILEYSDTGTGLPENINFKNVETLGLGLIKILSEQLNGTVEYSRDPKSKFSIEFYSSL